MKRRCVLGVSDRAGLSDDSRLTPSPMLPSVPIKTSASRNCPLHDSIPGPHLPLSTLHVGTCAPPRMTRGQTGSLHLICKRLSLLARCQLAWRTMAWTPLLGTASYVPKWKCYGNHLNREGHPDEHYDGGGRFGKDSLPGARR